jgi:hypothetical protein
MTKTTTPAAARRGRGRACTAKRADQAPPRKTPRNWQKIFLAHLGETSNVTAAAEAAAISLSRVYAMRRTDPGFARAWFDALAEGYDNLEMELLQHLRAAGTGGGEEGDAPAGRRKFDTATAFRCLAAHRDSVAREKGRRTLAQEVATISAINAKIDRLRLNAQASEKAIRAARRGNRARRRADPLAIGAAAAPPALPAPGSAGQAALSGPAEGPAVTPVSTSSASEGQGHAR